MTSADFLIVGGGVAGLSAGARLVRHGKVVILEAEEAHGYHSSGRSVSFSHYGIGNSAVRGLTAWSRGFFEDPPGDFCATPLSRTVPTLYFATEDSLAALEALEAEIVRFTDATRRIDPAAMSELCPALRTGQGAAVAGILDPTGLKLDSDALLQSFGRAIRAAGGEIMHGRRIASIERRAEGWTVRSEKGETWSAPILLDAAGAWADPVAGLAAIRPIGVGQKSSGWTSKKGRLQAVMPRTALPPMP